MLKKNIKLQQCSVAEKYEIYPKKTKIPISLYPKGTLDKDRNPVVEWLKIK